MRPQITFPKSLQRALNYHEKKVQKGTAELLHAHGFYQSIHEMSFHDKKERFEELMDLNKRSENKLIHISLNFHPSEKERLSKEFFIHLADEYMNKIGFGDQPYLVYQHSDAGHPHIHVLASLIKDDGFRIKTQYIGKNVSEPVRKEMEKLYGFIPADKKDHLEQQWEDHKQLVITPQKIQAGKSATVRSITNVLDYVVNQYKYTSIHELNAVLKLYNVKADRGAENGRIYRNRGLTYVVIDETGTALTKPVKASAFHGKPTLSALEKKFRENISKREPDKKRTINAIEWAFRSNPTTLGELAKLLQKERIDMVIRRSLEGKVFGLSYINHEKKTVFNGSDLDKGYAAKAIIERLHKGQGKDWYLPNENEKDNQHTESQKQHKPILEYGDSADYHQIGDIRNSQQAESAPNQTEGNKRPTTQFQRDERVPREPDRGDRTGKIVEQLIGPDFVDNSINKDLLTEDKRKKKRGLNKQWEM